jgi:hypothetical protein
MHTKPEKIAIGTSVASTTGRLVLTDGALGSLSSR